MCHPRQFRTGPLKAGAPARGAPGQASRAESCEQSIVLVSGGDRHQSSGRLSWLEAVGPRRQPHRKRTSKCTQVPEPLPCTKTHRHRVERHKVRPRAIRSWEPSGSQSAHLFPCCFQALLSLQFTYAGPPISFAPTAPRLRW